MSGENEDRGFVIGFIVGLVAAAGLIRGVTHPLAGGLTLLTAAALGWGWMALRERGR